MSALLKLWIWLGVYLNIAGWLLSSLHQLNALGYSLALLIFGTALWFYRHEFDFAGGAGRWAARFRRRFVRPLPLVFLGTTTLVFLGGLLYAPTNYDALTYRLPRILNWLAAGHWFWIPTINDRMNYSGVAWEWLAAPQFALFHSDRGLFLINASSFVLLPGLLFSVFRRVGVRRRVAWTWMWLLPLAYGYVTQAGSIGNDLLGAVFCLASVHFGLRARSSGRVQEVWLALLAAALMTGVKLSNLPLALPALVAVWPALPSLRRAAGKSFAMLCLAALASALPIMVLNQLYCGRWSGDPKNLSQIQVKNPVAALFGNSLQLVEQTFLPPVLPQAHEVYVRLNEHLPAAWHDFLNREFPRYRLGNFNELPSEENAGLGFAVSFTLVMILLAAVLRLRGVRAGSRVGKSPPGTLLALAAGVAFLFYMLKMGSECTARLLLPYYPLVLIPVLQLTIQGWLQRFRPWRLWLVLAAMSALPPVVLSPARPLWPAQKFSERLLQRHPDSRLARRMAAVYTGYASRNDALQPVRSYLPDDVKKIGLVAGSNDAEYSLWRPFGTHVVQCLRRDRRLSDIILPADVEWVVIHMREWDAATQGPLAEWTVHHRARIVATVSIVTFVSHGADDWCLLHLEKPPAADVMNRQH